MAADSSGWRSSTAVIGFSLRPPVGFGHRGAPALAPENSLDGFRLALRLGATGLETDAWRTADGEISASSLLERFGFTGDRLTARLGDLSGGERRRFQLLRLLLEDIRPDDLFLDVMGKADNLMLGLNAIAGGTGAILGGVLTDLLSWRWAFFVSLPFGVLALVPDFSRWRATRSRFRSSSCARLARLS